MCRQGAARVPKVCRLAFRQEATLLQGSAAALLDRGKVAQLVSHRCPRFSPCRSRPTLIVATTFPASGIG